jgi:hypothetical protein
MTDIDLAALKAKAKAVEAGIGHMWVEAHAFQETANPATVIALLDRLKRAEAKIAEAWDEGYDEAKHYERGGWNFVPKNPYRSGEAGK